ncbi:DM13 domain-containing protein [Streptomyces sp. C11-1]|uniref:DM13 domain-containing protein n=1 Tax=Streptomyces durocortorensis TaxID=2811104 RepID=A0ABY9VYA0_9ACTN|nr:DM13 domain-containing protein [Streptomyces durocortorensis]WNF28758.1 DM13 domain-containing protein [Streptomyces durocortorensis]
MPDPTPRDTPKRRPWSRPVIVGALIAFALVATAGLYWFQPWKLWQDETVREELVVPTAPPQTAPPAPGASAPTAPPGPTTLATGELISHEHRTTGTVKVVLLPDGSRTLRLEGLDTSNGPDLQVWITDAPVKEGTAGWRVFDDGAYENLGKLKGNKGDQNYALPTDIDLDRFTSVSIWCARFSVSFGAAELNPA